MWSTKQPYQNTIRAGKLVHQQRIRWWKSIFSHDVHLVFHYSVLKWFAFALCRWIPILHRDILRQQATHLQVLHEVPDLNSYDPTILSVFLLLWILDPFCLRPFHDDQSSDHLTLIRSSRPQPIEDQHKIFTEQSRSQWESCWWLWWCKWVCAFEIWWSSPNGLYHLCSNSICNLFLWGLN